MSRSRESGSGGRGGCGDNSSSSSNSSGGRRNSGIDIGGSGGLVVIRNGDVCLLIGIPVHEVLLVGVIEVLKEVGVTS